ncbi:MAG TPA: hypothetical protein VJH20_00945 [Candidatus Nanoarchaeia archaeon]|nr:hypothetical protein [Candidatus Nanoarchaeia archaeon]
MKNHSLEQILELCEETFDIGINHRSKPAYMQFLLNQLSKHREYKLGFKRHPGGKGLGLTAYPWRNLLADKVLLRAYILGDKPIIIDDEENSIRIGRENEKPKPIEERARDLVLLSPKAIGASPYRRDIPDHKLLQLYSRFLSRIHSPIFSPHYQNWHQLIDEIGTDKAVIQYFGRQINYTKDVCKNFIMDKNVY